MKEDTQPICESCHAALAADQRYCLTCGARRRDARLPFLDLLRAPAPAATATGAPATARWQAHLPLAALTSALVVALLIGVLLGHWSASPAPVQPAAAGAPPIRVITVATPPAAAPAAAAPAPVARSTPTAASKRPKQATAAPTVSKNALRQLQHLSGKAYQRQVDKLGKKISTGGTPPPKDNKPPAGGGSFQDIG